MNEREINKMLKSLEQSLSIDQLAGIGFRALASAFDKTVSQDDIDHELERWSALMRTRPRSERIEIVFQVHHLETKKLLYEYAKVLSEKNALTLLYISSLIACVRASKALDADSTDNEDIEKLLLDALRTSHKNYQAYFNEEVSPWDLLGYPRPESDLFELASQVVAFFLRNSLEANEK